MWKLKLAVFYAIFLSLVFPFSFCMAEFVLILEDTRKLWWEQGSLLTYFLSSFSSRLTLAFSSCSFLIFCLQRTLWSWMAFSQPDWLQDTFCKCHSGCVRCVNLVKQETNEESVLGISTVFCLLGYNHCHLCFFFLIFAVCAQRWESGHKRIVTYSWRMSHCFSEIQ